MKTQCTILTMALLVSFGRSMAAPMGTAFTYQGRLTDGTGPANGLYEFQFGLYDAGTNGDPIGGPVSLAPVPVSNGLFTVTLDFGASTFTGAERWLEITVSLFGSDMIPITLNPRQRVNPAPYALHALTLAPNPSATGSFATVGGGTNNMSSRYAATVAGGNGNSADGYEATVGGGSGNVASDDNATVSGGRSNRSDGEGAVVGGGAGNDNRGDYGTIGGGLHNHIAGSAFLGTIAGGSANTNSREYGTIGGGELNATLGPYATVGGGQANHIEAGAQAATIGGGANNRIETNSVLATIAGGSEHTIGADTRYSTIGGGSQNVIGRFSSSATIAGGSENIIQSNAWYASIGGGRDNVIGVNASFATVPGGRRNEANGDYSFAAGNRAKAHGAGSFVWGDTNDFDVVSTNANEFVARATGGFSLITAVNDVGVPTSGATLAAGAGAWSSLSDRHAKENFTAVNGREILDRIAALPLASWNYTTQDKSIRHLGPTAQDFFAAFALGESERTITTVDADGVALAAIKGLNQKLEEELQRRDAENADLKRRLAELERLIVELTNGGE